MKCFGFDPQRRAGVEIDFGVQIDRVEPSIGAETPATVLAPGFVDIQINGFAGVDYNSPVAPHEAIEASLKKVFATGTTRILPTVITGSPADMAGALQNLAQARESLAHGHAMEAFHVEGPHICPDDGPRGAHPRRWVRPPDIDEYQRWQEAARGNVRLVTVSPEWPGTNRYIEALVRQGVVVSIGHTNATAGQIRDAVSAGATLSTHLGNGAHRELQRHPNYIWEQMAEDRLAASLIVDGIHLGAAFLKVALRAKGVERSVLITDAVMPAECEPGPYMLGEVEVQLHPDARVTLRGGDKLAGSSLRMDRGVENLMRLAGLTLPEALTTATRNPARVARVAGRLRGLERGERGDVVEFSYDSESQSIRVLRTWLAGELVYPA
ncbi:MAG: amidohydrolase family protein [Bryobacterales bacterium]|nr:amidohydrolase family protein [Bryobacterales bacterium]